MPAHRKEYDDEELVRVLLNTTGRNANLLNDLTDKRNATVEEDSHINRNAYLHIIIQAGLKALGFKKEATEWDAPPGMGPTDSQERLW